MKNIVKIVLTGGPCAGKTSSQKWIKKHFETQGYKVIFVPETAAELMGSGIMPQECGSNLDYQRCQMRLQKFKEEIYLKAARTMPYEKILVVFDRGEFDNKAYMTDEEFLEILAEMNLTEEEMYSEYDAVFHLMTAAKSTREFYTLSNHATRYESKDEAAAMDSRTIKSWSRHPHVFIIDVETNFEDKMNILIKQISDFLDRKTDD